jgi:hypothetical protein
MMIEMARIMRGLELSNGKHQPLSSQGIFYMAWQLQTATDFKFRMEMRG